eukprot:TRINITY_DN469_c0_g1_i1.p1 TRINITY_DN469_c0_g1~~TRINITY_DN469_c0_g1_i1.p1  ORF type:complete len:149 (-),score=27.65 TRINITY_DN469_c0_g1_i1:114-560(-)
MVKLNPNVSSARRKQRKAHFASAPHERRRRMASTLSAELRTKYNVRSIPVRKDDEVMVLRGEHKGKQGKVLQVKRQKWCINIEKITREKQNGATVNIPINPSNVVIQKLKMNGSRKKILDRKAQGKISSTSKGDKFSEEAVSAMSTVD